MWVKTAVCCNCGKSVPVRKSDNCLKSHKVNKSKCPGIQGRDYKYIQKEKTK